VGGNKALENSRMISMLLFFPSGTGEKTVTIDYTYDPLDRLTTAEYSDGTSFQYTYDPAGNVLEYDRTVNTSTITTTYTYDAANQLATAQQNNLPAWQFTYDPNGRLQEVMPDEESATGARRYTYDAAGYLKAIEINDGTEYQLQAQMQYDGLGQRLEMSAYGMDMSITTQYVVDPMLGAQPLTATAEGQAPAQNMRGQANIYLYGLGPVAELTDAWAYPLSDGTNTPRQMTDQNGMVTLAGSYTPWGDVLDYTGEGNFMWGYFGGMMDASTGLLYVGNGQYYDPATGRFLTREDQPGKTNPYVPWGGDTIGAMLAPLALLGMFYSRKRSKGNKIGYLVILLFVTFTVSTTLSACGQISSLPTSTPSIMPSMPATSTATQTSSPSQTPTVTGRTIYLTFDDGPDPYARTAQIAFEINRRTGGHATFFIVGHDPDEEYWIRYKSICPSEGTILPKEWQGNYQVLMLQQNQHAIGLHGYRHDWSWTNDAIAYNSVTYEIAELYSIGVVINPNEILLRAPGFNWGTVPIPGIKTAYYYGTDIVSGDSENNPKTGARYNEKEIVSNIINQLKNDGMIGGEIVLLHSIWETTYNIIVNPKTYEEDLIQNLIDMGYSEFLTLPRKNPNDTPNEIIGKRPYG
jgi:RHS repeat-associated protein